MNRTFTVRSTIAALLAATGGFGLGVYWHEIVTPSERIHVCTWVASDPMERVESYLCSHNDEVARR